MSDLRELKAHCTWLEDQVSHATAVDDHLDEIDGRLEAISDTLDKHADALVQISGAMVQIADAMVQQHDLLRKLVEALTAPRPQPSPMADVFGAIFKPDEPRQPAAKPKPRKPDLSVVSKDSGDGPGAAS